ncbi:Cystatin [Cynara cardunculus var. scolymus]|uniref:Cystatin n=1 Tax=Cynara cardunculus var. scolymus TaxID=59895 RepID=A0A118JXV2_CYNCS|nr:Cystatin [Cynara cardunculus var. scolymus]
MMLGIKSTRCTRATGVCFSDYGQKTVSNWLEIASAYDPTVIEVGQFAVDEHNKDTNSSLTFERVIMGYMEIVGGMNWRLTIEVEDVGSLKNCDIFVYEQSGQNVRKLISFEIL